MDAWREVWERAPQGFEAPRADRCAVDAAAGEGASAYGELAPESAALLLRWLAPGPADVFYDLGSGTGKLVAQVACTTPVERAVGIELSPFRHRVALALRRQLLARVPPAEAERLERRLAFRQEDFRASDLASATIVYAGSTCYPDPLLERLAANVRRAPRLRALLSTRALPSPWDQPFREVGRVQVRTSWSPHERVVVYAPRQRSNKRSALL